MDTTSIQPPSAANSLQLNLDTQNNAVQQQIARLPVGVALVGTVVGNDKNGNLIVRLAGNDLILSSPLALNKNAQIALKIDNVSGSFVATLLSVDGKTPATQPQALSNQLLPNPNSLQKNPAETFKSAFENPGNMKIVSLLNQGTAKAVPQGNAPQTTLIAKSDIVSLTSTQNTSLKAILVTAAPEISQALKASQAMRDDEESSSELMDNLPDEIKPGAILDLKITTAQNPQQLVQTDNSVLKKQDWLPSNNVETNNEEAIPVTDENPATTNTDAKLAASNLQQLVENFSASFKPLPNGNVLLNAIVLNTKPDGGNGQELLVETRFGKVVIDAGPQFSNLQKGAVLDLEISAITANPKSDLKLPESELPLKTLGREWPALKDIAAQLAPELGASTIPNKLAGVENVFAARIAAFLNAVKTGNVRDWLGANNYDALESDDDGSVLLGKLRHDMSTMRDVMNQGANNSNTWQTMLFPVYDGRELHQARLHVKYLPDENQQPDKKAGTRFIVEVNTGYFGEMQMDGLVHNNVASKYFDMIIRTHKPLEEGMEGEIRQIFSDAGQITGFKGDIEFATMKEFPLTIFDDLINKKLNEQIDHKGIEA